MWAYEAMKDILAFTIFIYIAMFYPKMLTNIPPLLLAYKLFLALICIENGNTCPDLNRV